MFSIVARLWFIAMLTASPARGDHQISCPPTSYQDLQTQLKGQGAIDIVFFASWCSSCLPHLKAKHSSSTIFVAAFDEQARAEKVMRSLEVKGRCYTSVDIAESLSIKALPASKQVSF